MATLYKPAQYWINELFLQNKKSCVLRFQNRWTELVIELSVEAFWSEIVLVISNLIRYGAKLLNADWLR